MKNNESKIWLSSKETRTKAKIKSCDLMHYRNDGKLHFIKKGNAYFYEKESVKNLSKIKHS